MVITHNRGTIEAADALYGVTVGDDAVSRVISLKLADLPEDDAIRQLALEMIGVLEARIRAHPDQWMCTNRRWPKQVMRERGVY